MRRFTLGSPSLTFVFLLAFHCFSCGNDPSENQAAVSAEIDLTTPFERSDSSRTATYSEGIAYFERLADAFPDRLRLLTYPQADCGLPIHLAVYSQDGEFDPETLRERGRLTLMVNNAIHPGEPDGVDATMLLFRQLLVSDSLAAEAEGVTVVAIPFYNVGGSLNRSAHSRVNQNGPESYGFRGNANHLDLNRDFIKADSENAKAFARIFHEWKPDLYVENHVTNGADYQYVITYLATQKDKLGQPLGSFLEGELVPELETRMAARSYPMAPYVNAWGQTPDKGYPQFRDTPRYSTGYAALFGTLPFIVETHMLKPFAARTEATYLFMEEILKVAAFGKERIRARVDQHRSGMQACDSLPLSWRLDRSEFKTFEFLGYAPERRPSAFGGDRLYYDRSKPIAVEIPFYNRYVPAKTVKRPYAYLVPQSRRAAVERLRLNGAKMKRAKADTSFAVTVYYVENYNTVQQPYEGHYLHSDTEVRAERQRVRVMKGDWLVETAQPAVRYVVETLEPEATDSFFNWNFFDEILQQKEHFSPYVFEEKALALLEEDEALREAFEAKKAADPAFAADRMAQLDYVYERSPYYEEEHNRLPVFRVERAEDLPEGAF